MTRTWVVHCEVACEAARVSLLARCDLVCVLLQGSHTRHAHSALTSASLNTQHRCASATSPRPTHRVPIQHTHTRHGTASSGPQQAPQAQSHAALTFAGRTPRPPCASSRPDPTGSSRTCLLPWRPPERRRTQRSGGGSGGGTVAAAAAQWRRRRRRQRMGRVGVSESARARLACCGSKRAHVRDHLLGTTPCMLTVQQHHWRCSTALRGAAAPAVTRPTCTTVVPSLHYYVEVCLKYTDESRPWPPAQGTRRRPRDHASSARSSSAPSITQCQWNVNDNMYTHICNTHT
jgi:hypothetical protein